MMMDEQRTRATAERYLRETAETVARVAAECLGDIVAASEILMRVDQPAAGNS